MTMLIESTAAGLYCAAGGFYLDPWEPVDRAVITHAHGDHLRSGSSAYLCARPGHGLVAYRVGSSAVVESLEYGQSRDFGGVRVTFHPAGHILGSAQVRIEHRGEVWVVSGDYKTEPDSTCAPFEPLRCDTFITESTFGLPIYRWTPEPTVLEEIRRWWSANSEAGRTSVLFAYSLGKAQRVLAGLRDTAIRPIYTHGAIERLNRDYRDSG